MGWTSTRGEGVVLALRVAPGARRDEVYGVLGDELKVRVQAPPADGKANKALVRFLARKLGVPGSRVRIVAGDAARRKRVLVEGRTAKEIESLLLDGIGTHRSDSRVPGISGAAEA